MYAGLFVTIQVANIDWRTLVLGVCHDKGNLLYAYEQTDTRPRDRQSTTARPISSSTWSGTPALLPATHAVSPPHSRL
jgi:hypothetical protein